MDEARPVRPEGGERFPQWWRVLMSTVRRHQSMLIAAVLYLSLAGLLLRAGFGSGSNAQLPQGTNALDSVLLFDYWKHYPLSAWLNPYTDWGQPVQGFTGPTPLSLGIQYMNPTVLVRLLEFLSIAGAGLATFWVIRDLVHRGLPAFVGGFYYALVSETEQYFDGHVWAMMSVALAPLFLYLTFKFLRQPKVPTGIALALVLYLLGAIGDLGLLYFYVFFGILIAAYALATRVRQQWYRPHELVTLGLSATLLLILVLPWLVPFAAGVRPQLTTNITTTVLPFSQTSGQPIQYSLLGFVGDRSFTEFVYHQWTPAWDIGVLGAVYGLIPLAIAGFVIVQRNRGPRLLFLSGLVAVVFSTGKLYPVLSTVNDAFYTYIPYFNSVPALFRWTIYTDFVFAILLGLALADFEQHGLETWRRYLANRPRFLSAVARRFRGTSDGPAPERESAPSPRSVFTTSASRRARHRGIPIVAVSVVICALVVGQNWLVVSNPPTLFEFPSGYVVGLQSLGSSPVQGDVLTIPFSADYELTPWGGVSGSSLFMSPYFTGADSVMFQAGTAPSLRMDTFIGNGMVHGLTDNITKYLQSTNVEFIAATDYPNWNYSSAFAYQPLASYESLARQTGLGAPTFQGGYQTIYSLPGYVGNVSLHTGYYVYFGTNTLVYSILNQPWYNGSQPLIDGGNLSLPADQAFLAHASAIITDPAAVANLSSSQTAAIRTSGVPLVLMTGWDEGPITDGAAVSTPWNSSNGEAISSTPPSDTVEFSIADALASIPTSPAPELTARIECPPLTEADFSIGGSAIGVVRGEPVSAYETIPYGNLSVVSAGEGSQGSTPYNGSVVPFHRGGETFLNWSFLPNSTRFQYLDFNLSNLSVASGVVAHLGNGGAGPLPFYLEVAYSDGNLTVPSAAVGGGPENGSFEYTFYLPTGTWSGSGPPPATFGSNERFFLGLFTTSPFLHNLTVSDVDLYRATPAHFNVESVGSVNLTSGDEVTLSASTTCRTDSLTLLPGKLATEPTMGSTLRFLSNQPDPTDVQVGPIPEGWGLVELAQTYSPFWNLSLSSGLALHQVGNIGLNVWLINATPGESLHFHYLGQTLQTEGVIAEVVALPALALVWVLFELAPRFGLLRRRKSEPKKSQQHPPGG